MGMLKRKMLGQKLELGYKVSPHGPDTFGLATRLSGKDRSQEAVFARCGSSCCRDA